MNLLQIRSKKCLQRSKRHLLPFLMTFIQVLVEDQLQPKTRLQRRPFRLKLMILRVRFLIDISILSKVIEQDFEEGLPQLIEMVREGGEKALGLRDNEAKAQFIDFLKRFK